MLELKKMGCENLINLLASLWSLNQICLMEICRNYVISQVSVLTINNRHIFFNVVLEYFCIRREIFNKIYIPEKKTENRKKNCFD